MKKQLAIRDISQLDNYTFQIDWNDGKIGKYRLSQVQKQCPCANCVDEQTGQRRTPLSSVAEDVRAMNIQSIGRYAIKIRFTSGCSTGIYGYDLLHSMAL